MKDSEFIAKQVRGGIKAARMAGIVTIALLAFSIYAIIFWL